MTAASAVTSAEVGFGRLEPLVDSFEAAIEAAAAIEERDFRLAGAAVRLRSPNREMLRRTIRQPNSGAAAPGMPQLPRRPAGCSRSSTRTTSGRRPAWRCRPTTSSTTPKSAASSAGTVDPVYGELDGIPILSAMLRRSAFDVIGVDESLTHSEDMALLFRLRERDIPIEILPDVVMFRRLHGANLTGSALATSPLLRYLRQKLERERTAGKEAAS